MGTCDIESDPNSLACRYQYIENTFGTPVCINGLNIVDNRITRSLPQ
jgi:hypothetical protein